MEYYKGYMTATKAAWKRAVEFGAKERTCKGERVLDSFTAPEGIFRRQKGTAYFPGRLSLISEG